ncbi:hypothetical protein H1P_5790002 [Hyella patelloides LEGE 07179]|uniref:Uncharacterized protein n=1 Tax=Hyella patelloides LEGE 07179 TaxID=945734 RepID=A0A563W0L1_9CYAN|nr:hypothetical protein H1P_5790002 [Hyella patelloides LEGE 07179]
MKSIFQFLILFFPFKGKGWLNKAVLNHHNTLFRIIAFTICIHEIVKTGSKKLTTRYFTYLGSTLYPSIHKIPFGTK